MDERRNKFQTGLCISLTIFFAFCYNVESFSFSTFSQTKIIRNNCSLKPMKFIPNVPKMMDCGNECIDESECRRFLYCSSDSSCSLFHDGTDCIRLADSTLCYCFKKDIGYNGRDLTCPLGYYGNRCQFVVQDCEEAKEKGLTRFKNGFTNIKPRLSVESFEVKCIYNTVPITLILKRSKGCSPENFNRSMKEYEDGFGIVPYNRWLGFRKLLLIMNSSPRQSYSLELAAFTKGRNCFTYYNTFRIGDKASSYAFTANLTQPGSQRYCGDSMLGNLSLYGRPFSTYDSDHTGSNNCAARFGGGWWFHNSPACTNSFLTGNINDSASDNFWLNDLNEKLYSVALRFRRKK